MAINILVTRLTRGDDLKKALAEIVTKHSISAGSIASCVGSLSALNIRLAGAEQTLSLEAPFELVSLMGTLTAKHQHVHIAVSDTQGRVWGGHLLEGCLIDTTAELIIHHYPDLVFQRAFDEQTGFSELVAD
ncbi:DNA-binding protein [Vibrio cidicii]|uniref:DNA-binding protein n=1 Tax=Vibrio cidicii TaxID=1763883 RepID=A0A151L1Q7_9VIBR|nr:DUF296 domain-containing protein [Vibrio cidicii]KYN90312.1 DNA-binding protein [Vibrio cidicii]KYN90882.1 DNA-binding protein [Vibrio cidicii]MBG0756936.1 DNA-binding protein [Vibrio cidicii]